MQSADGDRPGRSRYTAVVYFHGMGSQRRLEEMSRLIDGLDRYAHSRRDTIGDLANIKLRVEPLHPDDKTEIPYVRLDRRPARDSERPKRRVCRFYEAYWASVTAGGVSAKDVLLWLFWRLGTPVKALKAPWRLRARLRRAADRKSVV